VRAPLLGGAGGLTILAGLVGALTGAMPEPARAQCSVFDRHPCLPYNYPRYYPCGLNVRPGCTPEILLPLNQVPVLHVQGHTGESQPLDRDRKANRLDELGPLLSQCLELPPDNEVRAGMRVTLKLAFRRDGALLGEPRFTYVTHEASQDDKDRYRQAALDMLKRCTPLPVTAALGGAIAGRPFVVPIIEARPQKSADAPAGGAGAPDNHQP
jgi:hypothetical protein